MIKTFGAKFKIDITAHKIPKAYNKYANIAISYDGIMKKMKQRPAQSMIIKALCICFIGYRNYIGSS